MMKIGHVIAAVVCVMACVMTIACSKRTEQTHTTQPKQTEPFVSWYSGYKMLESLAEPIQLTNPRDLADTIKRKWYAEVPVYKEQAPDKVITLSSCEGYLAQANVPLWAVNPVDHIPFLSMAMMCRATQIMMTGTQPEKTWLQGLQFDKNLPGKLPTHLALVISTSEQTRIDANKSLKHWKDVAHITQVEELGSWHAIYHDDGGGIQELEMVAKADFNGDKIEDMLITSRDSVVGGSYKNVRFFMLTKHSETGDVVILNEYHY